MARAVACRPGFLPERYPAGTREKDVMRPMRGSRHALGSRQLFKEGGLLHLRTRGLRVEPCRPRWVEPEAAFACRLRRGVDAKLTKGLVWEREDAQPPVVFNKHHWAGACVGATEGLGLSVWIPSPHGHEGAGFAGSDACGADPPEFAVDFHATGLVVTPLLLGRHVYLVDVP